MLFHPPPLSLWSSRISCLPTSFLCQETLPFGVAVGGGWVGWYLCISPAEDPQHYRTVRLWVQVPVPPPTDAPAGAGAPPLSCHPPS